MGGVPCYLAWVNFLKAIKMYYLGCLWKQKFLFFARLNVFFSPLALGSGQWNGAPIRVRRVIFHLHCMLELQQFRLVISTHILGCASFLGPCFSYRDTWESLESTLSYHNYDPNWIWTRTIGYRHRLYDDWHKQGSRLQMMKEIGLLVWRAPCRHDRCSPLHLIES